MKNSFPLLAAMVLLLTACGPDQIIADLPSPDGSHHVEVRLCPQRGSFTRDSHTQVSVLKSGESENCNAFINATAQFAGYAPNEQLQLEWLSDTELRAWHPAFDPQHGPARAAYKNATPITLTFAPAR